MSYDTHADADAVFAEHRKWGLACCSAETLGRLPTPDSENTDRRLRVGYVSADFREHALLRYFEPVLAHHDPAEVEVTCYAEAPHPDAATAQLQGLAHHWRAVRGLNAAQAAQLIRDDRIDILVDLAGHTAGNRLDIFALKPAPIQATWLGYLNTTGLSTTDYRITDDVLDPPSEPVRDTEELMRLPRGFCCFLPRPGSPAVGPLPALQRGHLTFGSLHSLFKLNSTVYDLWSRVLHALPSARLLVFRDTLTGSAVERVQREFTQRGIAAHRLTLQSKLGEVELMPHDGHLQVYAEIDVSLDAFPWTGGVTTCESLWMGVPMLSLVGARPAARNSAALLTQVGLNDWACATQDALVARALQLQEQLSQLADLRARLRERMQSTICDAARFTRELEQAYRTMWKRRIDATGSTSLAANKP